VIPTDVRVIKQVCIVLATLLVITLIAGQVVRRRDTSRTENKSAASVTSFSPSEPSEVAPVVDPIFTPQLADVPLKLTPESRSEPKPRSDDVESPALGKDCNGNSRATNRCDDEPFPPEQNSDFKSKSKPKHEPKPKPTPRPQLDPEPAPGPEPTPEAKTPPAPEPTVSEDTSWE
jgi:kexin